MTEKKQHSDDNTDYHRGLNRVNQANARGAVEGMGAVVTGTEASLRPQGNYPLKVRWYNDK